MTTTTEVVWKCDICGATKRQGPEDDAPMLHIGFVYDRVMLGPDSESVSASWDLCLRCAQKRMIEVEGGLHHMQSRGALVVGVDKKLHLPKNWTANLGFEPKPREHVSIGTPYERH